MQRIKDIASKLPSIVWVILIPLGIVLFIGGIMLAFELVATVEGVASIIMLIAGFIAVRAASGTASDKPTPGSQLYVAMGIVFFALMGMAIDQPGNFIYNKPLQLFCPAGTHLNRDLDIYHLLPGRTDIIQDYQCLDSDNISKYQIDTGQIILVRFAEYVVIGYALIGVNKLLLLYKRKNTIVSQET